MHIFEILNMYVVRMCVQRAERYRNDLMKIHRIKERIEHIHTHARVETVRQ